MSEAGIEKSVVLIVDDEATNIRVVAAILQGEHEIICATSATEGIRLAHECKPDLILLDVVMPEMSGFEVCAVLRADPDMAAIPIIFVTGLDSTEQEVQGLEAGAIDYVTKPPSPLILRARVRNQLELKRARDQLERVSVTDAMTGLFNRRHFDATLQKEFRRLARFQRELSVIMIDVDHFKLYNDSYGHPAGDACLRSVSAVVHSAVQRPSDLAARYGGEEFVCVLPETSRDGAMTIAENIRAGVLSLQIPHRESTTCPFVTVSQGVATVVCSADIDPHSVIELADQQLYSGKQQGRNQVRG